MPTSSYRRRRQQPPSCLPNSCRRGRLTLEHAIWLILEHTEFVRLSSFWNTGSGSFWNTILSPCGIISGVRRSIAVCCYVACAQSHIGSRVEFRGGRCHSKVVRLPGLLCCVDLVQKMREGARAAPPPQCKPSLVASLVGFVGCFVAWLNSRVAHKRHPLECHRPLKFTPA